MDDTYKGYQIIIDHDEMAEDPSDLHTGDRLVTYVLGHNKYKVPNDTDYLPKNYSSWDEMADSIKKQEDILWMERVDMYEHGGMSIHLGGYSGPDARWDSGQLGWVYVTKKDARKQFMVKRLTAAVKKKAIQVAKAEVEEWGAYVAGDVWWYQIRDKHGETIDSCSGFIGDIDRCKKEAEEQIDWIVKKDMEHKAKRLKALIAHKVPLDYRPQILSAY